MSRRVTFSGKVKAGIAGAEAKASLNRANESLGVDPKLGELSMARVKWE
jgi:hypothetical protein